MDEADRILNLDFEKEVGSFCLFKKPPFSFLKQQINIIVGKTVKFIDFDFQLIIKLLYKVFVFKMCHSTNYQFV